MCMCVYFVMCGCSDNCVGVLVMRVFVFMVFCIVFSVSFIVSFMYKLFLFPLSVLVQGLPPPGGNSIAGSK